MDRRMGERGREGGREGGWKGGKSEGGSDLAVKRKRMPESEGAREVGREKVNDWGR